MIDLKRTDTDSYRGLPEGSKNRDKTQNIEYLLVAKL